ncbi:MAG: PfkB family carbohydrate kinase [Anaerolineales bacterium]
MTGSKYDHAFVGGLRQDYCITHDGRPHLGMLGGNAVYAAVGAKVWSQSVGVISRVGANFPESWLEQLEQEGIDIQGVRVLPDHHDTRTFYAYLSPEERVDTNPASHFLRINQPLPKELLDYHTSTNLQDSRDIFAPLAVRPTDLPEQVAHCKAAHLAPADFLTHHVLPFHLREVGVPLVTLDPSMRYMDPSFWMELPVIVSGLDAFLPSEAEAAAFFGKHSIDAWEMAEAFGAMGSRFVVIKRGARGQFVLDVEAKKRWHVPAFPARVTDVTGAGDAFCGGFLASLAQTQDVLEAVLHGNISASLTVEGTGALFALDAVPGLANARLEALRPSVRQV